jgi:hypothetical protein
MTLLTARPMGRFFLLEDEDQEKDDQDESDYPTTYVHRAPPYTGSGTSCLQDGSTVPPDDSANPHIRSCEPSWRAFRSQWSLFIPS